MRMQMKIALGMALAVASFATTQAKDVSARDSTVIPAPFIKEYAEGCVSVVGRPDRELIKALSKLSRADLVLADPDGVLLVEASTDQTCRPLVSAKKLAEFSSARSKCDQCPPGGGWILIDSFDHKTKLNSCVTINTTTTVYWRLVDGRNEVHTESSSEFVFTGDMDCVKE